MTGTLLIVVGVLYVMTGLSYLSDGNVGMCIAFICYAGANFGLYLGAK